MQPNRCWCFCSVAVSVLHSPHPHFLCWFGLGRPLLYPPAHPCIGARQGLAIKPDVWGTLRGRTRIEYSAGRVLCRVDNKVVRSDRSRHHFSDNDETEMDTDRCETSSLVEVDLARMPGPAADQNSIYTGPKQAGCCFGNKYDGVHRQHLTTYAGQ